MAIYDCFTFFNEIELLKARLEFLKDVVDYHVIIESNLTHSGNVKEYNLDNSWEEFKKWHHKIIYVKIKQFTEGILFDKVDYYTPDNGSWVLENQHRNGIYCIKESVTDSDYVLLGDADEFPDPEAVIQISKLLENSQSPIAVQMLFHYYFMNCQNIGHERLWNGTVMCTGKQFKEHLPQHFRDNRNNYPRWYGGYHFSFLGGFEKIKTKIESFAHTEFNREDIISDQNIKESIEKGKDVFNRPGVKYKVVPVEEYPENIRNLMLKYPQFIKT